MCRCFLYLRPGLCSLCYRQPRHRLNHLYGPRRFRMSEMQAMVGGNYVISRAHHHMALYDILNLCQNCSKHKLVGERWHKYIEVACCGLVMDSSKMLILPHLQWSSHDKKKVTFWKIYNIWVKSLGQVFSKEDNVWLDNTLQKKKKTKQNTLAS